MTGDSRELLEDLPTPDAEPLRRSFCCRCGFMRRAGGVGGSARALAQLPKLERIKQAQGKPAGTTDAQARVMKMAGGGFRPAYTRSWPAHGQPGDRGHGRRRQRQRPGADGADGPPDRTALCAPPAGATGGRRFRQARANRDSGPGHHGVCAGAGAQGGAGVRCAPCRGDSGPIAAWRQRMGTDAGKAVYKVRVATAEFVNVLVRNRGLQRFNVCGLDMGGSMLRMRWRTTWCGCSNWRPGWRQV